MATTVSRQIALGRHKPCVLAIAAGLLLVFFGLLSPLSASPLQARDYKMAGDAMHTRVVLNFDSEPDPKFFLLRSPHRLVIDLPDTRLVLDPKEMKERGLVSGVRYGHLNEQASRLVLTAKGPFTVERFEILPNENSPGYRLIADLSAASDREFDEALSVQAETTGSTQATPKGDRLGKPSPDDRFTVVIDAGHGGIDGGAEGPSGTVEKDITLSFATELRDLLSKDGRYQVFMTRDTDEFLRLDDRVRIARQHDADLFLSIHADTIRLKGIRGATVYTVSDTASDEEAKALADRENLSDQLAGIVVEEDDHEVADILVDLIRRETHSFSMRFARSLVDGLATTVRMINNPHRFAGFKVLKAPDVPSVLIELGYLSNLEDEEQLRSAEWRGKVVASISSAIAEFASEKLDAGG
jgi:N-acetylmuramoyl-L-alanine amidase